MSEREQRLVFGEVAELYDRMRPSYPAELVEEVLALSGAGPGDRAVDAGCGTGRAAVLLAERGLRGVGVEPNAAMAAVARRNLASHAGWTVVESSFENYDGPAGGFRLVTSAQAWHWMDPDARIRQAHRLLEAGGWLCLWWNRPGDEDSAVRDALDAAYDEHAPALARGAPGAGRPPGCYVLAGREPIPPETPFGTPVERDFPWEAIYSAADYVALMQTQSNHRLLPDDQRTRLHAAIGAVIDAAGGTIRVRYTASLWAAQRH